jgi:hypothetical protein
MYGLVVAVLLDGPGGNRHLGPRRAGLSAVGGADEGARRQPHGAVDDARRGPCAGHRRMGFAALLEVDGRRLLIDTGARPETVRRNAEEWEIDLSGVADASSPTITSITSAGRSPRTLRDRRHIRGTSDRLRRASRRAVGVILEAAARERAYCPRCVISRERRCRSLVNRRADWARRAQSAARTVVKRRRYMSQVPLDKIRQAAEELAFSV